MQTPELDFYFGLIETIKRRALGITPNTPQPKNIIFAINRISEPLFKDDYHQPWSPIGVEDNVTKEEITRRQRALKNLNDLVDKKLLLDGSGFADPGAATIYEAWTSIVLGAQADPRPLPKNPEREKQVAAAREVLFADGGEPSSKYKVYQEMRDKYDLARAALAEKYYAAAATAQGLNGWPVLGKPAVNKLRQAEQDWSAMGHRQEIEGALDVLGSEGRDAAESFIAGAKRILDNTRVPLDALGEEVPLVSCLPSNWCDPASIEGFTHIALQSSEARKLSSEGQKSFKAAGSFLSLAGGGSTSSTDGMSSAFSDDLSIEFDFGVVRINRPYLKPVLFNLGGWFIGSQPKHCISSGTADQAKPENTVNWLPALPVQMVVMKNLKIKGSKARNLEQWANSSKSAGGGGTLFGISLGAKGSKTRETRSSSVKQDEGGVSIDGSAVIGWVLEVLPATPKIDGFQAQA